MLLSYLLTCGCCVGGLSKMSQHHYGSSTARNIGTCDNRLTVREDELEGIVIGARQSRLMDPALCAEFCEEYTRQRNALRGAKAAQILRGLVDSIVLTPDEESNRLEIDLYGELADILGLAEKKDGPLDESDPSIQLGKLVAGAGFHLNLRKPSTRDLARHLHAMEDRVGLFRSAA